MPKAGAAAAGGASGGGATVMTGAGYMTSGAMSIGRIISFFNFLITSKLATQLQRLFVQGDL